MTRCQIDIDSFCWLYITARTSDVNTYEILCYISEKYPENVKKFSKSILYYSNKNATLL